MTHADRHPAATCAVPGRTPRRGAALLAVMALLAACSQPPRLPQSDSVPAGPAPALLPVDGLLAQARTGTLNDEAAAALAARGAALRARAAAITPDAAATTN